MVVRSCDGEIRRSAPSLSSIVQLDANVAPLTWWEKKEERLGFSVGGVVGERKKEEMKSKVDISGTHCKWHAL